MLALLQNYKSLPLIGIYSNSILSFFLVTCNSLKKIKRLQLSLMEFTLEVIPFSMSVREEEQKE